MVDLRAWVPTLIHQQHETRGREREQKTGRGSWGGGCRGSERVREGEEEMEREGGREREREWEGEKEREKEREGGRER